jgi:glycine/D-amino acid oxidase-like deaminating enzyme/nitrite reductase/ring-hydroxylating ferredoxin subunit
MPLEHRMSVSLERSVPLWTTTAEVTDAPALTEEARADVVVVGSGIAGLSAAYELAKAGRSVIVLDRGPIAGGMTARTTGHLTSEIDDSYGELIRVRGLEEARLYRASHAAAIDRIETIQKSEQIACDFARVDGYLFLAAGDDPSLLEKEHAAAREVGCTGVEWVDQAPLPAGGTGRALRFPGQGRFHPLKYLEGLAASVRQSGGRLFARTPVTEVAEENGEVAVRTGAGPTVRAGAAIVATNSPINDRFVLHSKQAPYRTYVIAARIPKGSVPDALFWDTGDPYHYVRLQPGAVGEAHDVLIVGGEDHKTGQADDGDARLGRLEGWARERFPSLQDLTHRWSGQVMEPVDLVAFIGRNHGNEHVYIATGDSGEGITHGVIAGMLLRDLIQGRENAWQHLYDPRRISPRAVGEFLRENLGVAAAMTEHLRPGEVASVEEIRPGEGAVTGKGLRKVAAYRDENGQLHVRSATCTHAGCVVHWNRLEQCWDCPCHGSQFAFDGTPLNGPATAPLAEVSGPIDPA